VIINKTSREDAAAGTLRNVFITIISPITIKLNYYRKVTNENRKVY